MTFNQDVFHDYVVAHGFGAPTDEGYELGKSLMVLGDDYATAAAEVCARGFTIDPEDN